MALLYIAVFYLHTQMKPEISCTQKWAFWHKQCDQDSFHPHCRILMVFLNSDITVPHTQDMCVIQAVLTWKLTPTKCLHFCVSQERPKLNHNIFPRKSLCCFSLRHSLFPNQWCYVIKTHTSLPESFKKQNKEAFLFHSLVLNHLIKLDKFSTLSLSLLKWILGSLQWN